MKTVDVIIPVYNEEKFLSKNITILSSYLERFKQYECAIVIANNGSTDNTARIGKELALHYSHVRYMDIPAKGKGIALRIAFLGSKADVVSFMDADLSTDLTYFHQLLDAIENGYHIAVGSRHAKGAMVKRSILRRNISKVYNRIVKILFPSRLSDLPCGFKAFSRQVISELVPLVRNNSWFFDSELLLLAEYNHYKIKEIPVQWIEYPGTKLNIIITVFEYLWELLRLRFFLKKRAVTENKIDVVK